MKPAKLTALECKLLDALQMCTLELSEEMKLLLLQRQLMEVAIKGRKKHGRLIQGQL